MKFWKDKWCSNDPLGALFLALYSTTQDSQGPVSLQWAGSTWNIKVQDTDQELFLGQSEELINLLLLLLVSNAGDRDGKT